MKTHKSKNHFAAFGLQGLVKSFLFSLVSMHFAFELSAALVDEFSGPTIYVDCNAPQGGDGSKDAPFSTIQAAIDSASPLSVVEIAAGKYDNGVKAYSLAEEQTLSRVVLDKKLRLKGAGRDKTFIVGAKAASPDESGNGTGAVRCVLVSPEAAGALIEGVSLKGGRTASADISNVTDDKKVFIFTDNGDSTYSRIADSGANTVAKGGGAFAVTETPGGTPVYLVDVTVDDCQAGYCGGGLYGNFVLIRCLVKYCRGALLQSGAVAGLRGACSSIFTHCGGTADGAKLQHGSVLARARAMNEFTTYVNCTMASNRGQGMPSKYPGGAANLADAEFYNCAFFDSHFRFTDNGGYTQWNCVMNSNGSMPDYKNNIGGNWGEKYVGVQYWLASVDNATGEQKWSSKVRCDEYGWDQLVSLHYDFRPRANAFILDKGDVKWITAGDDNKAAFVPSEYLAFDFKGDPRTSDNGTKIAMGAYQQGVTLGVGFTVENLQDAAINGYTYETPVDQNKCIADGLYGEPYSVLEVSDRNGEEFFGLGTTAAKINSHANSNRYVFPRGYGLPAEFLIRSAGDECAYVFYKAASIVWVDPEEGVDADGHGTELAPYKTLQYAQNHVVAPGVLIAKPGHYQDGEGDCKTDGDWLKTTKARLTIDRNVRVCSTGGAGVTFIHGRSSTDDVDAGGFVNDGCGAGALRCVMSSTSSVWPALQGFTLTGGRTDSDPINKQKAAGGTRTGNEWDAYNWGCAGVCGWSYTSGGQIHIQVSDCVISDCVGYRATVAGNAFFDRCVFKNNRTIDISKEPGGGTSISNYGSLFIECVLSSCLVENNDWAVGTFLRNYNPKALLCYAVNSTFIGNQISGQAPLASPVAAYGCVFSGFSTLNDIPTGGGNVVWPSAGSWTSATKVLANPLLVDRTGADACILRGSPAENLSPYGDWSFNSAGLRGLDGALADYTDGFCTAGGYQKAVDPRHFYVNAAAADDSADGLTPTTAKRTLNGALGIVQLGDVVHVAEGVYRENAKLHDENLKIKSLAIVPERVTLVADGEQAKTIIEGQWGGASDEMRTDAYQNMTFGEDGIRCVYAAASTVIRGFTLRNGGVLNAKYKDGSAVPIGDKAGAGVYGTETTVVEDCLFTNLVAASCAGLYGGGTAKRCRFVRVGADSYAVCLYGSLYNCFIDYCFDVPVGASVLKNCTVGPNCKIGFGEGSAYKNWYCGNPLAPENDSVTLENVIVMSKSGSSTGGFHNFPNAQHCIFVQDNLAEKYTVPTDKGNRFVSLADIKIGANGCPLPGSPAIDAGCSPDVAVIGADVDGGQRIYNSVVDIGCCEYDWRAQYARDLKARRIVVTSASPNVAETAEGNVRLTDGCELALDWPSRTSSGRYEVNLTLVGSGILTIKDASGQTLVTYDTAGEKHYEIPDPDANTALSFAYAGTGSATLGQFRNGMGMMIFVR